MITKKHTEESGFSLLEMLIAMTILAIGLLGVAALQLTAIQGSAYSMTSSQATAQITNQFEQMKTKPIENIVSGTQQKGIYTLVTTASSGPVSGTKAVKIVATWTDQKLNTQHNITYQSVFADSPTK